MALFQNSVISKYLKTLDKQVVAESYARFKTHFHNPVIQENIRNSKEEQYQGEFLIDLFVKVLGYTKNPTPGFNLTTEYKNVKDGKKADGAILVAREHAPSSTTVIGVIELKGTETTDLNKIENQAFAYKNNQPDCAYVITSNFEKLRFYIDNAIEHLEFNLFTLNEKDFELLYLCLAYENIAKGIPKRIKEESVSQEGAITKKLYNDYSLFKRELHQNLVALNPQFDALTLFKKSQKLLDRFLFLYFAEDRMLLPPNSVRLILDDWRDLQDRDVHIPLYDRFRKYFDYLNTGFKGKRYDVFAYNGGLFKSDELLDNLKIEDELLFRHTFKLSDYDFASEIDVNILGHIFENSLNELDEIKARLEGTAIDKTKTKRKKDGVFYTPKYITKYIVDNTIGKLCTEKKAELQLIEEDYTTDRKRTNKIKGPLLDTLTAYRNWLLKLTICDPACGSGAFLNQALDFLISEHRYIDELQAKLFGDALVLSDIEKSILENNLFGVDLNEESVEIAKLSLWLRTAQPNRKLNDLNNNIKCGNSLIDEPAVAGDKAFNWQKEFPQVFIKKEKRAWHITCATHNSRYSQRMFENYVKLGEPVWLSAKEEIIVTETIAGIVEKDHLNMPAYNICGDHMHLVLVCEEEVLPAIVQKIKSISARACNIATGRTREHAPVADATVQPDAMGRTREHAPVADATVSDLPEGTREHAPLSEYPLPEDDIDFVSERGTTQAHLWTQKYGHKEITTEEQLHNTISYIQNNRVKHGLPELGNEVACNKGACSLVTATGFCCSVEQAFRPEYKGGFDVVIGNPPYGILVEREMQKYYTDQFPLTRYKINLYVLFIERMMQIFDKGIIHFIIPKSLLFNSYFEAIRMHLIQKTELNEIYTITEKVFEDAEVGSSLLLQFTIKQNINQKNIVRLASADKIQDFVSKTGIIENKVPQNSFLSIPNCEISIISTDSQSIIDKLNKLQPIKNYYALKNGLNPGNIKQILISNLKETENHKPIIWGRDISKYSINWSGQYVNYDVLIGNTISLNDIQSKVGMNKQNRIDFALRSPDLFEKRKIVVRKTGDSLIGCLDENNYYFDTLVHGIYKQENDYSLEFLLSILNSKPATKFYLLLHDIKDKVFAKISLDNLSLFPIPNCNSIEKDFLSGKAKFQLTTSNKLKEVTQKFHRTLQRKFTPLTRQHAALPLEPVDLPAAIPLMPNWYQLSYAAFIQELAKKKIKLSLSEEAEWETYFLQESAVANQLKEQIDATDAAIDQMVYLLYGLTEEEIKIVEGN